MPHYHRHPLFAFASLVVGVCSSTALAGLDLRWSYTVGPVGQRVHTWSYGVSFTDSEAFDTGDFFTIYDFAGYVPDLEPTGPHSAQPEGWVASAALVSDPVPGAAGLVDDPGVMNVTFTRTGPRAGGPDEISNFLVRSDAPVELALGTFVSRTALTRTGRVDVPVPEPTAAAGLLMALGFVTLRRRHRRQ